MAAKIQVYSGSSLWGIPRYKRKCWHFFCLTWQIIIQTVQPNNENQRMTSESSRQCMISPIQLEGKQSPVPFFFHSKANFLKKLSFRNFIWTLVFVMTYIVLPIKNYWEKPKSANSGKHEVQDEIKNIQCPHLKVFWGIYILLDSSCSKLCLIHARFFKMILTIPAARQWEWLRCYAER